MGELVVMDEAFLYFSIHERWLNLVKVEISSIVCMHFLAPQIDLATKNKRFLFVKNIQICQHCLIC